MVCLTTQAIALFDKLEGVPEGGCAWIQVPLLLSLAGMRASATPFVGCYTTGEALIFGLHTERV